MSSRYVVRKRFNEATLSRKLMTAAALPRAAHCLLARSSPVVILLWLHHYHLMSIPHWDKLSKEFWYAMVLLIMHKTFWHSVHWNLNVNSAIWKEMHEKIPWDLLLKRNYLRCVIWYFWSSKLGFRCKTFGKWKAPLYARLSCLICHVVLCLLCTVE